MTQANPEKNLTLGDELSTAPAEAHEHQEHHEHIEYTDRQIERAHQVLGISGMPYLLLDIDKAAFAQRGIDIAHYVSQSDTSFFAPGAIPNLLGRNKWNEVYVEIGPNSNIQEIGLLEITQRQTAKIKIGAGSSIAHGVKFLPSDGREIHFTIGDNTFVGIGTRMEEGIVGNNCSIGFNCHLKNDVVIGDYVTICDGAVIEAEVVLPPFTVVPPGVRVTREMAQRKAFSPEDYVAMTKVAIEPVQALIQFTPAQQQEILAAASARNNDEQDGGDQVSGVNGNVRANSILTKAGMEASSLFLTQFNPIVVSENRLFPLIYRLIGKFHPDHVNNTHSSAQAMAFGANLQIVDLPVDRTGFIKHYMDQVEQGVSEEDVKPYRGEFSKCGIDWERVIFKGDAHIIGQVEIKGTSRVTEIGENFVSRFDEGKPGDTIVIDSCKIGPSTTIHAVGSKRLESIDTKNNCVLHGAIDLSHSGVGSFVTLHNVQAAGSKLHGESIILGARIKGSTISTKNTIIGHHGPIQIDNVSTGREMVVLHNVTLAGREDTKDGLIWFGNGSKVRENTVIYGQGEVSRGQLFGPNATYQVTGDFALRRLDPVEAADYHLTLAEPNPSELQAFTHGSAVEQLPD